MHRFEIQLGTLQFRDCMKQDTPLKISLLQDSQLLDQTNQFIIKPDEKQKSLIKQKSLLFFSKQETINNPVYVQIMVGAKIKKCLIKRVDQLRQFKKGKTEFDLNEDFGTFKFSYKVKISQQQQNNNFLTIKKVQITKQLQNERAVQIPQEQKISQKSSQQLIKETKDSKDSKQEQNLQGSQAAKMRKRPSKLEKVQNAANRIRENSQSKYQNQKQDQTKKQQKSSQQFFTLHKTQSVTDLNPKDGQISQSQLSHGPFFSTLKSSKRSSQRIQHAADELITTHHPDIQHDHSHGHGPQKLSIKLKIVIFMLVMGFLFLMYDALDDRFSQRKVIQQSLERLQKLSKKKHKGKKKKSKVLE